MNIIIPRQIAYVLCYAMTLSMSTVVMAASLDNIEYSALPDGQIQVQLQFSEALPGEPTHFTIDDPARIAMDFPEVSSSLEEKTQYLRVGVANSVTVVEGDGRTRVVLSLVRAVPYTVEINGSNVFLNLSGSAAMMSADTADYVLPSAGGITDVDFQRGSGGEGRIMVRLSDPSIAVNMVKQGDTITLNFVNTELPIRLDRTLDVVDFATPVKEVDTAMEGNNTVMRITPVNDNYDHVAYQTDDVYMIELKPLSVAEREERKREKQLFEGERISLNFQDIEVRAVLQLLADFNQFNLVVSDTVSGSVTLRLKNVPWDQALDIVLKTRGLGMRKTGNVVLVAPQEELANRERVELETERQIEQLAPLRTEFIRINYADASNMASLIGTVGGGGEGGAEGGGNSLLSERGNVSIDSRTNTLIIQDVATSIEAIRELILELDVPVRQVLIESRIVNADNKFSKDIGVRFGYSKRTALGTKRTGRFVAFGGSENGVYQFGDSEDGEITAFGSEEGRENLLVDLPALANGASATLALGKIGSYLLQLELSALIAEGRGEEIASPRVITADKTEAVIESGSQVPYQEATSSGATTVSFKDATLRLTVTPQITPDDKVLMDLQVNQDLISSVRVNGVPAIDTKSVSSQVLVDNGETVVLGGIYEQTDRTNVDRVPFFSELPYVDFLFKRSKKTLDKEELLIFVTPKILWDELNI